MLVLDGLTKRYGDIVALDGAGFEVRSGRILGFLGPNGAGKTTAMRCVFGLAVPDEGTVQWHGRTLTHADRLTFGYMPEERGLYPKMKIGEQLAYFARLSGLSPKDAAFSAGKWLAKLDLADRSDSKLEELSHGNQQRVQLAAALVHDPVVAILDEPFAGLDPIGVETMSKVLEDLAKNGVGIVFSSHQLDLVEDVCEDVVIINQGRVVVSGQVDGLKAASTKRHMVISVDGEPWTPELAGVEVEPSNRRERRVVLPDGVSIEQVLAMARSAGTVTKFSFEPPTLTDLFRDAVL